MSKLLMKLISLIACFGLLLNANYINTYAYVELMPNIKYSAIVFEPHTAIYEYTGEIIVPIFSVNLNGIVDESEYEWEVISIDDKENETSAGILPGEVTIEIKGTGDESHGYYGSTTATYQIVKVNGSNDDLKGDCNSDGIFGVSDVVLLQKWLLSVPDTHLTNWRAADFTGDGRLDVFDLCLMKRQLINNISYSLSSTEDLEMENNNMPKIIDEYGKVTIEMKEILLEHLKSNYKDYNFHDFTLKYIPDASFLGLPNGYFKIYYKEILLNGYGGINKDEIVFATVHSNNHVLTYAEINFIVDPIMYTQIDITNKLSLEDIEKMAIQNGIEYSDIELSFYISRENDNIILTYKLIDNRGFGETILNAVDGKMIDYIPYIVY